MIERVLTVLTLLFCGFSISAATTAKNKELFTDSFVQESQSLSVGIEQTVQVAKPTSRRTFDVFIGRETATYLNVNANGQDTLYKLDGLNTLNLQYGYYPYREKWMFGLIGGIGYSYMENHIGDRSTALHMIPIDAMLSTRYAFNSRLEALASVGGGVMTTVQRGDELDNTSQAKGYGIWQVGVSYGPKVQSDMPWEVMLMYGRRFGPSSDTQNWNGSLVRLGVGVRLD